MSQITHKLHSDNLPIDIWRVDEPDVTSRESTSPDIQFQYREVGTSVFILCNSDIYR